MGKTFSQKNELLFERGVNFNDVPRWQQHGVGLYWENFEKTGRNPVTGDEAIATRRRVRIDKELPRGAAFAELIDRLVEPNAG